MDSKNSIPVEEPSEKSDVQLMRVGNLVSASSFVMALHVDLLNKMHAMQMAVSKDPSAAMDVGFRSAMEEIKMKIEAAKRDIHIIGEELNQRSWDSDTQYIEAIKAKRKQEKEDAAG